LSCPISFGTRILGGGAVLLVGFLAVGWILPGTWSARAATEIEGSPEAVLSRLDGTSGWRSWTTWPDSGTVEEGPAHGAGSRLSWDDPDVGSGVFEIRSVMGDTLVHYRVRVHDGAMTTEGTLTLRQVDGRTRVEWQEEGDFGPNPLMGYWARFMRKAQSREMEKSLRRLKELVEETPAPAAAR
jgi:hypothetical protein